ncbi:luciferase family protein [Deinococcus pimensis]|uniref:luciferase domain-containing protein n=1 Tax=Deinococcus pimensis TaxID=309888 RepID=UPI00146F9A15|nr:luciferase family protein [Deinococcus pimensis]
MVSPVARLQLVMSAWPDVTVHSCPWGGLAYFARGVEFARLHPGGVLDVQVTLSDRTRLVREGRARAHRFWPQGPWVTVSVEDEHFGRALAFVVHAYALAAPEGEQVGGRVTALAATSSVGERGVAEVPERRRVRVGAR